MASNYSVEEMPSIKRVTVENVPTKTSSDVVVVNEKGKRGSGWIWLWALIILIVILVILWIVRPSWITTTTGDIDIVPYIVWSIVFTLAILGLIALVRTGCRF